MNQTYMEATRIEEGERLAIMLGEGIQHPDVQLRLSISGTRYSVELLGTRRLQIYTVLDEAIEAYHELAQRLESDTESCLDCGGEIVVQTGRFSRNMTTGEVVEVHHIVAEQCVACQSQNLSYRNK